MHNPVTSDLSQFGYREIKMAAELLNAYVANTSILGDGVHVCFNMNSGFVFLSDEDYNVAMMNGDTLEIFHSCPECGEEGFAEDINWSDEQGECGKCAEAHAA